MAFEMLGVWYCDKWNIVENIYKGKEWQWEYYLFISKFIKSIDIHLWMKRKF